jgi:hypothetical protein
VGGAAARLHLASETELAPLVAFDPQRSVGLIINTDQVNCLRQMLRQ